MNRRVFVMSGAAAVAGSRLVRGAGANDRVRVAVIGVRSRGTDLINQIIKQPGAELVAICDVDPSMFAKPLKAIEAAGVATPRTEADFRKILEDKSIDAIVVATPDHWHAMMTVMGCQAGKDVYVEKPASHNVVEGRRMVEAARKYGRIVQVGTQRRSTPHVIEAIDFVKSGALGKVGMARAWIHQQRPSIGKGTPGPVPEGVDYELWQGPALDRPFMANRFHYNWHWFWNWGTGELGNNGIHGVDVARWGLGVDAPTTVTSGGGKYVFDDDQEVPDTQIVTWDYPGTCIVWEHRMWSKHGDEGSEFGIAFYGDKGTLIIDSKGWHVADGSEAGGKQTDGQAAHVKNFLECVKSRKAPNAEIEIGHASTRLCQMGNIAHRTGRKLSWDAATESFGKDAEANALLFREYSRRFEMPSQV